nr:flagellar hook-basal body complex protein [Melioribacteraceae bacterium]
MSLLNSLFAGVSGLRNHQTMLDVIGNNIANVNSIGFKGSRITFSDTFNQYVRYGTDPTTTTGGTNSFQVGLGMKVNSIDRNWTQGTFERTGLTTDLAIQGNGLFILKSNGKEYYSRAGAYVFDAEGKLVNPQNGAIVQGKVATEDGVIPPGNNLEDIYIDTNLRLPAVATTQTSWGGNLSSTSPLTRTENFVQTGNLTSSMAIGDTVPDSNVIYDMNGNAYTMNITYAKTAADSYDMTYDLVDSDGNTVIGGPQTVALVFDPATGALQTMGG